MNTVLKCKYSKKCGNCQLLGQTYQETLNHKLNIANNYLTKARIKEKIKEINPSPNITKYRNKMIIAFKFISGKVVSGFYEENSHTIVDIDECLMHTAIQNKIAGGIKKIVSDLKLKPYDEDRKTGLIRYVVLREAFNTSEILVTIVTSTEVFPARSEFVKRLRLLSPNVKTIVQNINPRKTSIVLGDKERILYGEGVIKDILCGMTFYITSKSFYQINPRQTENLYNTVKKYAKVNKNEIVLDAYSGVGTIGMYLASEAKNVISVENNKQAVEIAHKNARINKISNINLVCADATKFIVELAKNNTKIDTIIMDPPRSGSTVEFIESVFKLRPQKIVYVSCGIDTLARDLSMLLKLYKITNITSYDMFCWTSHIESIVSLSIKEQKSSKV